MLSITIPKITVFDNKKQIFYYVEKDTTIQLEHSLISLQKWEARWHKAFLKKGQKTTEEVLDYIRCMCVTPNVKDDVFYCIPPQEMERIYEYLKDPMSATYIQKNNTSQVSIGHSRDVVTAEVIYYWMITLGIPTEYRKWHLNQLLTLIEVINLKNAPRKKKQNRQALLKEFQSINEQNKKLYNTSG